MSNLLQVIKSNKALQWILGFQFFRLILLPFMGLMPQDAYYYLYGQNLSLSYLDHPPMIGYLLRFTSEIFGQSVFVVKCTDFVVTSITMYAFYKLATKFLPSHKQWRALLLMCSTLFISILSFNSTPDVPLLLFWTLSILCLYKAIFEDKKLYWILGGVCMGLAFDSKYTALFLQFGLIAFLLFSKEHRKLLLSPWLWLCFIISIAVMFPVWWWNYQNDFASFTFQSTKRAGHIAEFNIKPQLTLGLVAHQLALLLPVLFLSFLTFSFKHVKKAVLRFKLPNSKTLFLLAFFIPTFLGFIFISPFYWVKLNWLMPTYIPGVILSTYFLKKKHVKVHLGFAVVFHLLVSLQVLFYLVPIKSDDTWKGWEELSIEVKELQKTFPDHFIFSADDYKTTAVLNFYLEEKVYAKNVLGLSALHFDFLDKDLSHLDSKNAIYIDSDKRFKNDDKRGQFLPVELNNHFESIEELDPIIIKDREKKLRKFWVYICKNYKTK